MRFVETKRGTYEIMNDVYGLAVAVSIADDNDVFQFGSPSESLADSEIIARINAIAED